MAAVTASWLEVEIETAGFNRKGGLIGLAAATVGLSSEAAQHLEVWIDFFAVVFGMLYVHEYRV
ncbi:hypothetical protein Hdeb2414_s0007g00231481 [Helianthus debilis subsp. tardiflorus]